VQNDAALIWKYVSAAASRN